MPVAEQFSLSGAALAAVVVIVIVEVALMVYSLIDLVRRPHVVGPKWLWAVLIIVFGVIGPIVYLAAGRSSAPVEQPAPPAPADRVTAAADLLYGPASGATAGEATPPPAPPSTHET